MNDLDPVHPPDQHLDPLTAASYDAAHAEHFAAEKVEPAVALLAELAGDDPTLRPKVVEFAVGTGRLALPLSAAGVTVFGIDSSEPMLAELGAKPGAERLDVTLGDMTRTRVCDDASLVYLVFNTIGNLRSQAEQVTCFANAAAHLRPGGRFVVECVVPRLHQLSPGETIIPFDVSTTHLGFDEYVDRVGQLLVSHHYYINGDRVRTVSGTFRYVWPSELDLMAQLAGLRLESRWADWHRNPFTADSSGHVSVWRR